MLDLVHATGSGPILGLGQIAEIERWREEPGGKALFDPPAVSLTLSRYGATESLLYTGTWRDRAARGTS